MCSGGFKFPEEVLHRGRKVKTEERKEEVVTEKELEEQKHQILADLNITQHAPFAVPAVEAVYDLSIESELIDQTTRRSLPRR